VAVDQKTAVGLPFFAFVFAIFRLKIIKYFSKIKEHLRMPRREGRPDIHRYSLNTLFLTKKHSQAMLIEL